MKYNSPELVDIHPEPTDKMPARDIVVNAKGKQADMLNLPIVYPRNEFLIESEEREVMRELFGLYLWLDYFNVIYSFTADKFNDTEILKKTKSPTTYRSFIR